MGIIEAAMFAICITLLMGSVLRHILPRLVPGGSDIECGCGHKVRQHTFYCEESITKTHVTGRSYRSPCMCFRSKGTILDENFWGRVFNRKKR